MDNHLDKDNYPNGEGALQQMFNRLNNLGFQGGEISQVTAYTVIMPEDQYGADTSFLNEKVNGQDFVSICLKTLNVNSSSCYELGMVKVENLQVTGQLQTYLQPFKPVSKVLRKIVPEELIEEIEKAPSFKDRWQQIEPFLSSQVIVGAESGKRRFSYLCGKYELDMPIMAYVGWRGSEPWDLKRLHDEHKPLDTRTALDYALEWAQNEIADKSNK
jgi:hypothetical protein